MPELDSKPSRVLLLSALMVALMSAGCGGGRTNRAHTVTFPGAGTFPPSTIVGSYSVRGCMRDAKTLVQDAHAYYTHSTSGPGPADLYYFEMRFDQAHFEADGCPSTDLGHAMQRGLTPRQQRFLLHNVAGDLYRAFNTALKTM